MKAFQLKIAIKNSKPPIWRRVIVPAGITFSQLSMILNEVMGWSGYHLFEVEFYHLELRIIENADEYMDIGYGPYDYLEASTTYIREYLEENDWFTYTYDLGDDWQHRVTIEKILDDYDYNYPQVLKYKGNCPPEDCGGIYGYYEYLDIINDKDHPEYEERLAWMEMQGYPCEYDMEGVNARLREQFFYKWGKGEKRLQGVIYEEFFDGKYGLNASKRDKNKNLHIIKSGKHKMEDSFQMMSDFLKQASKMESQMMGETTLKEIFGDFEKEDLADIAKEKGIKGISGCNKNKLIERIVDFMLDPKVMRRYFLCFADDELREFEKAAETGILYEPEDDRMVMRIFETAYIGMLPDGKIMVPQEVAKVYASIKNEGFEAERKKVSYLLCCLRTAGTLYGILPFDTFMQLVDRNPDVCIAENEVGEIIRNIPPEFADYVLVNNKIYHKEFYPNDRGLIQAQGDKAYYIPTCKEILDLGEKGYLPDCRELKKLERYLTDKLCALPDEAEVAVGVIQRNICSGCDMQEVFNVLIDLDILPENDKQLNEVIALINDMWNHTRMILNRGFTPNEIAEATRKSGGTKIIPFRQAKTKKIYPNDPCPCGSGKKYKNCCKNKK